MLFNSLSKLSSNCPFLAISPFLSYFKPSVSANLFKGKFPGHISKAVISSPLLKLIFIKPPMFKKASACSENSKKSPIGTKGAPCPPATTSKLRKSFITGIPVRNASVVPQPICCVNPFSGW